jgi:hypothetical protein
MTKLPLGSTWVMIAATSMRIVSERATEPRPSLPVRLSIFTSWLGSTGVPSLALGSASTSTFCSPKKSGIPSWSRVWRERLVSLDSVASSDIVTCTVSTSPRRRARWSRKKPRAPERHNELAPALCTDSGSGIGRETGR